MNKLLSLTLSLSLLCVYSMAVSAQDSSTTSKTASSSTRKRGPVFRANKEQVNQAQVILKTRGMYGGGTTGKLDDATRAGLKEYQKAEGLKVTGTLNRLTLEKMSISLTEKQKAI